MVIAHDFDYVCPASLDEAVAALAGAGPGAHVLAGGTDVVPWLRDDGFEPSLLVDIKAIPGLAEITCEGDQLDLGALVTFTDLLGSDVVAGAAPVLAEMAVQVASVGVRNRATVVGNLCSAVPSMDAGPVLLVYDASVRMFGPNGTRTVPLAEWLIGPRATQLETCEIVTGVTLQLPGERHGAVFSKLGRYSGEDLAQVNLAIVVTAGNDCRVAFGAVAPKPFRSEAIEARLRGRPLDAAAITAVRALVAEEISPITDVRASAEYRTHMCRVMLERGLRAAASRLAGDGPPYPAHLI